MTQLSVDDYAKCVRASGLIANDQLDTAIKQLVQKLPGRPIDSRILAQHLLDSKLITPWHQSKLVKGCSKGFFIGRYKLLAHLGTGGMSRVYVAVHTMMKRQVAIKVLNQKLTQSESHLQRFLRESQAAAALDHINVVRAYDVDCDRDLYYFVMEYVEGPTLQQLVEKRGPLAADFAAEYIRQAAEGLHHAHENRLVHRDVKPGNLLVNHQGIVKVLDLGMVRLSSEEVKSITIQFNESMLGTADYLAPEQALDCHNVDRRADIYSLGCSLYFLLAGRPPFAEGSMAMRLMRHQGEAPPVIPRDDIPKELLDICHKMMAKTPDERYSTMAETAADLQEFVSKRRPGGKVFPPLPPMPGESGGGDTVTEAGGATIVNEGGMSGISSVNAPGSAVGSLAQRPPVPAAPVPQAPAPQAPRPAAPAPAAQAPAAPATPRPADIAQWKQQDYLSALLENDAKFINAVRALLQRFNAPDKVDKVVGFLDGLLKSPAVGKTQINAQSMGVVLLGLSATQSKGATSILQKVILNRMGMGVNDATAVRLAVAALGECPSPDKDRFLVELLANAEQARPAGGAVEPGLLRQVVAKVVGSKLASNPRLKAEMQAKLDSGSLNPEALRTIQKLMGIG